MTARQLACMPWCNEHGCDGSECTEYADVPTAVATAKPGPPTQVEVGRILWDGSICIRLIVTETVCGTERVGSAELRLDEAEQLLAALHRTVAAARAATTPTRDISVLPTSDVRSRDPTDALMAVSRR